MFFKFTTVVILLKILKNIGLVDNTDQILIILTVVIAILLDAYLKFQWETSDK